MEDSSRNNITHFVDFQEIFPNEIDYRNECFCLLIIFTLVGVFLILIVIFAKSINSIEIL